jgi:hypothetical protein
MSFHSRVPDRVEFGAHARGRLKPERGAGSAGKWAAAWSGPVMEGTAAAPKSGLMTLAVSRWRGRALA